GALRVAQTAVVKCDAAAEELRQTRPGEVLLFRREGERFRGQGRGEIAREFFSGVASRSEEQDWPKISAEGIADEPRPAAADTRRSLVWQRIEIDFLQWHRPFGIGYEDGRAANPAQPRHNVLRIGDAAAEQEELCFRRREGERKLVIHAARR